MKASISVAHCPPDSQVRTFLRKTDFEDAYAIHLRSCPERIEELYLQIFSTAPLWIEYAMRFRNIVVAPFGLKTEIEQKENSVLREGEKVGIFRIYKITENEVIAGEDDKHLNFRVSVHRDKKEANLITVSTLVQYNNVFGRIYISLISPFHKMVVKSILKSLLKRLSNSTTGTNKVIEAL